MKTNRNTNRKNLLARITLVAATTYVALSAIETGAATTPPLAPSPTPTSHATTPAVEVATPTPLPATTPTAAATTEPDAVTSENEPATTPVTPVGDMFVPTSEDIDMAVAVLTRPDNRTTTTNTHRWAGPTITYSIDLPGYPTTFLNEVDAAITFIEHATGIDWVLSTNPQVTITTETHNGGRVHARPDSDGYLQTATVWLGCCRTRVAWEELAQVMGAFGDHTDGRSVFSNNRDRDRAGAWEAWLLASLYRMPAGADEATIRTVLATPPG